MSSASTVYIRRRVAHPSSSSSPDGCSAVENTCIADELDLSICRVA